MNYLYCITLIAGAIAGSMMLYVIYRIVRTWLQHQLLKETGVETTARILHVEVMNERNRHVPFVKLQLEVHAAGDSFITEAASFFPKHKLSTLVSDKPILIRYNPLDISQVQVIKETVPVHEQAHKWEPLVEQPAYQWLN